MPFLAKCAAELHELARLAARAPARDPEISAIQRDELATAMRQLAHRLETGPGVGPRSVPIFEMRMPRHVDGKGSGEHGLADPIPGVAIRGQNMVLVSVVRRARPKGAGAR